MSSKENIEDLFREGLGDYQVTPSEKVWSGINKKMTGPRLEASYRNAFEGFRINPSEQLWRRVAAAIWIQKFIHFTPFSFNIYYLAVITTAIVGTVVTVNNNPDLDFVRFDDKNYVVQNTDSISDLPSEILIAQELFNLDYEFAKVEVKSNDKKIIALDNIANKINESAKKSEPISVNSAQKIIPEKENLIANTTVDNNATNSKTVIVPVQLLNDNSETENNSADYRTLNATLQVDPTINSSEPITVERSKDIIPSKLFVNKTLTLKYKPQWFELADNVFTGLPEYETIVKDTIGYNYQGEPVIVDKSWFEAGFFYSPYLYSVRSSLNNNELISNYEILKKGYIPKFSSSTGISLSYNFNRFRIESGLSLLSINESFSQLIQVYDTLTVFSYDYFQNSKWNYDTTMILDLDEYLQGNIVYIEHVDSTQIYFEDSLLVSSADSILIDKQLSGAGNLKYLGIPLIAGYEFAYGRFAITPKAGLICGILINSNGTAYNVVDGKLVSNSSIPLNKFVFDYYAAINLQYRFGDHFTIFAEPHLRGAINSAYKENYPVDQRSIKYGVRTGISYRF